MNISEKIATDYDTNLPPEKLKAATQNEQNDGWLIVKNSTPLRHWAMILRFPIPAIRQVALSTLSL